MTDLDTRADRNETEPAEESKRSRRQLLTLAGAAAAGGAAMVLANPQAAGAADGDAVIAGQATSATNSTMLSADVAPNGVLNIQGDGEGDVSAIVAAGTGNGLDIKLAGTGRLGQAPAATGGAKPLHGIRSDLGGTRYQEIVRSDTGVIWASTGTGAGSNTQWKRINSLRVDNPDGSGAAFTPFRLLDTRDGSGSIPFTGRRNFNTTNVLDIAALPTIPNGAVAVFGNVTVVAPNRSGFLTMYPSGAPQPTVAAVNFRDADNVVNNAFIAGLGTTGNHTGKLRFILGSHPSGSAHVIIDINGYVQ